MNANPLIILITDVKVAAAAQEEADFFIKVKVSKSATEVVRQVVKMASKTA